MTYQGSRVTSLPDPQVRAHEAALALQDSLADTLVGAQIGNWSVFDRVKPGARWVYLARERRGEVKAFRGYELVRLARQAHRDGLTVLMPREPWSNQTVEQVAA